ncbi:hypothetical protein FACS189431_0210 [Alphaproteobacteria bacterium]|nr:hypothetical protein FACS189431_0210 [Alphaproteobacteria bacterium]
MVDKKTTKVTKSAPKKDTGLSKNIADLRGKTEAELHVVLATAKADLLEAQKALKANELANPQVVRKMRREIARIKTVLTEVAPPRHSGLVPESNNESHGSRNKSGMTAAKKRNNEGKE